MMASGDDDDGNINAVSDLFVPGSGLLPEDSFPHHISVRPQEQLAGRCNSCLSLSGSRISS